MIEQGLTAREQRWADRIDRVWDLAADGVSFTTLDTAHADRYVEAEPGGDQAGAALTEAIAELEVALEPSGPDAEEPLSVNVASVNAAVVLGILLCDATCGSTVPATVNAVSPCWGAPRTATTPDSTRASGS